MTRQLSDLARIRAFAEGLIDEAKQIEDQVGKAGAATEIGKASAAARLIILIDELPQATSPDRIPLILRRSLDDYAAHGIRPGSCLSAVLMGDLFTAFSHADEATLVAMPAIVAYVRTLPPASWGSPEIVTRWVRRPRS